MAETTDLLIFWGVVAIRFLLPLAIPRYPIPAIVGCLVIDTIDQTIFQLFTSLPLEGYQGYDKALDIYYLTIAYISTLRNWTNLFGFKLDRFLFYYRLFGVTLFELTHLRPLLLIFPNTFEYFFIFYEAARLRWDPRQLTKKKLIAAAAFIWILIKLPQEYWIHIAQLDTTDMIKAHPITILVLAAWGLVIIIAAWLILKGIPPDKSGLKFAADPLPAVDAKKINESQLNNKPERFINSALVEKIVMVSLVSIIFAQILPEIKASNIQIATGIAFVIIINTALSHWLARRGKGRRSTLQEFAVMTAVNFGLIIIFVSIMPSFNGSTNLGDTLFFVMLLTLIVTLYDRYRQVYLLRFKNN
jgi:hypothetical protein